MGILINKSDFIGDYAIAKSGSDNIDLFIAEYENQILSKLLGSDLLTEFQSDLNNQVPQTQKFKDIYYPFVKKIDGVPVEFFGMKKMVLSYVYFFYMRKGKIKASMNGAVVNETENATQASYTFMLGFYNRAIKAYKVVRYICLTNLDTYQEFAGVQMETTSIL